jgi:hypothetical protein
VRIPIVVQGTKKWYVIKPNSTLKVKAYKNGDLSHYVNLRIKANMKIKEFSKEIEEKLHIVPNKEFRFFNQEGLELGIDDL